MLRKQLPAVIHGAVVLIALAALLGLRAGTASAAPADAVIPAGNCCSVVVQTRPPTNTPGGINTSLGISGTPGINTAPGLNRAPAPAPATTIATPTRATGSLVVPVPAASGGAASTRYQIVVPGPNPAQNTSVALSQLLSTLLSPPGGQTPVAVYPVPASPPR